MHTTTVTQLATPETIVFHATVVCASYLLLPTIDRDRRDLQVAAIFAGHGHSTDYGYGPSDIEKQFKYVAIDPDQLSMSKPTATNLPVCGFVLQIVAHTPHDLLLLAHQVLLAFAPLHLVHQPSS